MTTDYRVSLDAFEGPLDLLLYLIRRAEIDIHDIPISQIAEQYMAYLGEVDRIDIDLAGEFLVMAATLMEIKSRMLAPPAEGGATATGQPSDAAGGAADPRADLIRQLLEYKRYRDAADALERRREEWAHRFPSGRAGVDDERLQEALAQSDDIELEDVSLVDLVEAFGRIIAVVNFDRLGEHQVVSDDTPIELHAEDILDRLRREAVGEDGSSRELPLQAVLTGRTRSEAIGLFLAMLELVRRRAVRVRQEAPGGAILIGLRDPDAEAPQEAVEAQP